MTSNKPTSNDDDQQHLINSLRQRLSNLDDPEEFLKDDQTLRRYLMAYQWSLDEAERRLLATLTWRLKMKPREADCRWCRETPGYHTWRQVGLDRLNRPVVYSCFRQSTTVDYTAEDSVPHLLHLLENAKKCMEDDYRWVWVLDCTGISVTACNPKLSRAVNGIVADHYPERLGLVIVINHSAIFEGLWKAMTLFIHPDTVAKFKLARGSGKVGAVFTEVFPDELRQWLHEESRLNKVRPLPTSQREFWRSPADSQTHDARGCSSYIASLIDTYFDKLLDTEDRTFACSNNRDTNVYEPHPSIAQELEKEAELQKTKQPIVM